jgi:type II secretory pathway pseudopilin PulG
MRRKENFASSRRSSRQAGFTYVGLLFLVAMMGYAMTVTIEVWEQARQRDREEELLHVGGEYRRALQRYYLAGGGERYPRQLEDLLKDPRVPSTRRFLRRLYPDPMTGSAEWGLVLAPGGLITGVYSKSEAEPIKKAEFRVADQGFVDKKKYSEWVFAPRVGGPAAAPAGQGAPAVAPTGPPAGMQGSNAGAAGAIAAPARR